MTDAPIADSPTQPPSGGLERWAGFIGQIARPLAIIVTSLAASVASIIVACKVEDGNDGAFLMGAIFGGVAALYIGKAVEVFKSNKAAADVEIARATTPTA